MKSKEKIKINFATFVAMILIIAILIIIIVGGVYFYINSNKNSNKPESDSNSVVNFENTNEDGNVEDEEIVDPIPSEVYSIKDKTLYWEESTIDSNNGMRIMEYDNTAKDYAEIYYILYDYSTDPSYKYTLKITDESDNNLIKDDSEPILIGGMVLSVKIKKMSSNDIINFAMYEKDSTNEILQESQIQIDLKNDLEEKVKIDQTSNLIDGKLGNISFKYIDDKNVYFGETSHGYSQDLVGENASFPIKVQYGNYLVSQEHIDFSYEKNVNNLELENAFESYVSITKNIGQYGLSDVYGIYITNEDGEITDEIIVTFEEMMELANGETVEKNGQKYTAESFGDTSGLTFVKKGNVEIGNGINAIKYRIKNNDELEYYMFIYGDNIYTMTLPTNERMSDEAQQFIDSLEISE